MINIKLPGIIILLATFAFSQNNFDRNYVIINPDDSSEQIIRKTANVIPSERQYEWQKMELTGFIHFGINTFNKVEWGERNTDITKFNPTEIDVKQWVKVFKDAGMKLIILTTKHHDGFCLWPSEYTDYDISNTPFQNGIGDIVRDLSNACRDEGIKFGVYLSPWDMHEKTYGTNEYNQHFMNQLTELLTNYGGISEVWFDGANGEGANGRRQIYDWHSYYELIRMLQPNAVIAIMGPDVRWVGTESGYGRQTEWSVLPGSNLDQERIAENSQQQSIDGAFIPRDLMDEDLGSRKKIENASSLIWYPAEIDVSIRPRWFFHDDDNDLVKSPYKLVDIYFNSVGLNGVLLLNIPPDRRGLIQENDIKSMQGMRDILDETFKENLVQDAIVKSSNEKKGNEARFILDNDLKTYWTTEQEISSASIEIQLNDEQTFNRLMIQENILEGQRIEKFHLEFWNGIKWEKFVDATTIGYKRLLRFSEIKTSRIKLVIDECRTNPTISFFGLYMAPPEVTIEPERKTFNDSISIKLKSDVKNSQIFYTIDGSLPNENSERYSDEILLYKTTTITAIAVSNNRKRSLPFTADFNKAKYAVELKSDFDPEYSGGGIYALVDGVEGSTNFNDGKWQGYHGIDLEITVDLGEEKEISKISTRFLNDISSYIFLPEYVEYSVSNNGKDFTQLGILKNNIPQNEEKSLVKTFEFEPQNISAKFIRIKAKNISICPDWHIGAGDKAWLFVDEIRVE